MLYNSRKSPIKNGYLSQKPTIKDIAKEANVSPTTVSLVLKNEKTKRVGESTRKRIIEIAAKLNYRPNYNARALIKKESRTIGLVITTLVNPFYSEISQDILGRAKEMGYSVIISSARGGIEDERGAVQSLLDRGAEGLIICSALRDDPIIIDLFEQTVPFVLALRTVKRKPGDPPIDSVIVDNERGGYLAVEHLVRMGHRKIAILTGDQQTSTGYDRLVGATAALDTYGIEKRPDLILKGDFQRETGFRLAKKLLANEDRPTAVFAHNDHMAIGALEALRQEGVRIPEDMALVGFDDIEMAGIPGIDLTTVSQKKATMGRMAVDSLLENIRGKSEYIAKQIILDPIFIIRKSCGFHAGNGNYKLPAR